MNTNNPYGLNGNNNPLNSNGGMANTNNGMNQTTQPVYGSQNVATNANPTVQNSTYSAPVQQQAPSYAAPVQPTPVQNAQQAYTAPTPTNTQQSVNPMAAVANLNKEEAMEEALSHTNQYTPFEVPKQEVLETPKKESNKSAYILFGIIIVIMALFIIFLPQISKMFGW